MKKSILISLQIRVNRFCNRSEKTALEYLQLNYLLGFLFEHQLLDYDDAVLFEKSLKVPFSTGQLIPLGREGSIHSCYKN